MRARSPFSLAAVVAFVLVAASGCQLDPPPLGSAPSIEPVTASVDEATVPADQWEFPAVCLNQWWQDGAPTTIHGGTGPRIAVVGDSLTTQSRQRVLARPGFEWSISSFCGSRITDWLPDGDLGDELAAVRAFEPEAIVIALGTNDAKTGLSVHESAPALLAELPAGVPVTWVLPAPSHDRNDFDFAVVRAEISSLANVTVVDWARFADVPGNRLDDNTHMSWDGAGTYAALITAGTQLLPAPASAS